LAGWILERASIGRYTRWLFNIAMENCPFIADFPIKTSIYEGFSMAMLNNQMVYALVNVYIAIENGDLVRGFIHQ